MIPTRGERTNNPGNIDRNNTQWQGMSDDQSGDPRFACFTDPVYGIRALAKTLLTYYRVHNLHTVRRIIGRWAPPSENDTGAYITHVAQLLNTIPDAPINVADPLILEVLVKAIITHENGRCIYDDAVIASAIDKALA